MGTGRLVGPDIEETRFDDMAAMLTADYTANGRTSLNRVEDAIAHLSRYFDNSRALDITSDRITAYTAMRQQEGAANSTINKELSALGRMFTLAQRAGKVITQPHLGKLQENNARKGFFEQDQFNAVLKHLPEALKPLIETAYITGWRIDSEIITRQRHHVDTKAGWLRLDPEKPRTVKAACFRLPRGLGKFLKSRLPGPMRSRKQRGR